MCLKGKKILITGGLGFIGRTLTESLIFSGCGAELFAIDIKDMPDDAVAMKENVKFDRLDIRNATAVKAYFSEHRFDGVVHLAAVSRVVVAEQNKRDCIETNYIGTKNLAEAMAETGSGWMIFGSSREVYGESAGVAVKEDSQLLPLNIYGFYKLEGERTVRSLIKRNCVLRFCNVYGNTYDIPGRVVPAFVKAAIRGGEICLEGGNQIIDFTFIDDTVSSIVQCMKKMVKGEISSDTIHISPGVGNRITDIIDILRDMGFKFNVKKEQQRDFDVQRFVGDPSHREEVLGRSKFRSLRQGIEELVEMYRGEQDSPRNQTT